MGGKIFNEIIYGRNYGDVLLNLLDDEPVLSFIFLLIKLFFILEFL